MGIHSSSRRKHSFCSKSASKLRGITKCYRISSRKSKRREKSCTISSRI